MWIVSSFLITGLTHLAQAQPIPQPPPQARDLFSQILEFIYTIAHGIGQVIVNIVQAIVPSVSIPQDLVDPIGLMSILTIFLAVAEIAKRLTWLIIIVGWILILIRISLVIAQG
jgi:hypothetical protein